MARGSEASRLGHSAQCQLHALHALWSQGALWSQVCHANATKPMPNADRCMLPCGGTKIMARHLGRGGTMPGPLPLWVLAATVLLRPPVAGVPQTRPCESKKLSKHEGR